MNERELSQLLHDAAGDVVISRGASPRTLRRTRLRMAANSVLAISLIVLVVGGGFTLANRTAVTGAPNIDPAGPITTPKPQDAFLSFIGGDEVILAEVQETNSLWAFVVDELRKDNEPCLWSMNYAITEGAGGSAEGVDVNDASGAGDCVPLGVPGSRHLGFYMWDSGKNDRLEVLGQVSTDVSRLELQDSHDSNGAITIIQAPDELDDERNFFYLWLPMGEVGNLVAYDSAGNVLQESELCFEPGAQDVSCTVGEQSGVSGSGRAELTADISRMACDEISPLGGLAKVEAGATPEDALQAGLDGADLQLRAEEFESERIGPGAELHFLPGPDGDMAVSIVLSRNGKLWKIEEAFYCERLVPKEPIRSPPPSPSP